MGVGNNRLVQKQVYHSRIKKDLLQRNFDSMDGYERKTLGAPSISYRVVKQ